MDNSDDERITDSFLTNTNQYIVQGDDEEELAIAGDTSEKGDGVKDFEPLREQDRFLPIANLARIMKTAIPLSGKIAKDAKECVQECVSEFVSFITSEASDRCNQEKRKTINGEDILFAMSNLGFDGYVEPLTVYLQKYREAMKAADKTVEDSSLDELRESDVFISGAGVLEADQQNITYATSYAGALAQQIHFA